MKTSPSALPLDEPRRGGRPAAGTDPLKRRKIIDGADRIFSVTGFDAASMSDVSRAADVSKATLYVYFENKEQLFATVCAERRDRNIADLIELLDRTRPIETVLMEFGSQLSRCLSDPFVISAHRVVIGVVERMPEIGHEFFKAGPQRLANALAEFLSFHTKSGELIIDDPYFVAAQFLELTQATIFRPRLYGVIKAAANEDEIKRVASSAVRILTTAYRT